MKNCPKAVFDSKRPGALNATQKKSALYAVQFLFKIQKKNINKLKMLSKIAKKDFKKIALHSVQQDASFELSKTAFGQFFIFFIIRGTLLI